MSKANFLLSVFLIIGNSLWSQQLDTIPDLTYWNASYSSPFPYVKKDRKWERIIQKPNLSGAPISSTEIKPIAKRIELAKLEIYQALKNKNFRGVKFETIDTNTISALLLLQSKFHKNSYVTLDYWDGNDAEFKTLLTYLYNASIAPKIEIKTELLQKAKRIYNKIPLNSLNKGISYTYINMVEYSMMNIDEYYDQEYLEGIDSVARRLSGTALDSYRGKSILNEVLGDFWSYYAYTGKSYGCYEDALESSEKIQEDSVSVFFQKRIASKLEHVQFPYVPNTYVFNNYSLFHSSWNSDLDIYHRGYASGIFSLSGPYELNWRDSIDIKEILKGFFASTENLSPEVALSILEDIELVGLATNDQELYKKSFALYLKILEQYGLVRNRDYCKVVEIQFLVFLKSNNLQMCHSLNDIILRYAEQEGRYYWKQMYHINEALISISERDFSKAKGILHDLIEIQINRQRDLHFYLPHRGTARRNQLCEIVEYQCNMGLQYIAMLENNMNEYVYYQNETKYYKDDFWDENDNIIKYYVNKDRNAIDDIFTYKLLVLKQKREQDSMTLFSQTQRIKISDSLRISTKVNDSLIHLRTLDALQGEKEKEQQQAAQKWYIAGGIISFFVFVFSIVIFYYRFRQNRLKLAAQAEKKKLESEKVILELESLRASYLDHAIGGNFKYIRSLIRTSLITGNTLGFETAINVTNKLSRLFHNITHNSTGQISLSEELGNAKEYVELISECVGNAITCKILLVEDVTNKIFVPSFSLSDFYINAVNHGKLIERKGSYIQTTIDQGEEPNIFTLTIENNGIGKEQAESEKEVGHKSSGHDRVTRRFEIFNQEKHKLQLLFDKSKDFTDIVDQTGNVAGTKITIKIVFDDTIEYSDS